MHNVMLVQLIYLKIVEASFLQTGGVDLQKDTFLVRDTMNGSSHHGLLSSLTKSPLKKRKGVSRYLQCTVWKQSYDGAQVSAQEH